MGAFGAWALARISEPSTWAGIAGLVGSMTFWPQAHDVATALPMIGTALSSVLAIVIAEQKAAAPK